MRRFAALFGFCLGAPALAMAAEPVSIKLDMQGCPDVNRREVERVLATELAAQLANGVARHRTLVLARCEGTRLVLHVNDPVSRKILRRSFDLGSSAAAARSRLVAIAASELVLASWAELEMQPVLRVEPEGARPARAAAEARRQRVRRRPRVTSLAAEQPGSAESEPESDRPRRTPRWLELRRAEDRMFRVVALGSVRGFVNHDGALFGGGLRIGQEPLLATSWALDTLYETGSIQTATGDVEIHTWTLGGMVFLSGRVWPFTGRVGAGLRAGVVASPTSSDTFVTPWGWPFLALSGTARVWRVVFDLSGEAGYVELPNESSASATLRGVWLSAQVGVGVLP